MWETHRGSKNSCRLSQNEVDTRRLLPRRGEGCGPGAVTCPTVWSGAVVFTAPAPPHSETVRRHLPLQHRPVQVSRGSDRTRVSITTALGPNHKGGERAWKDMRWGWNSS